MPHYSWQAISRAAGPYGHEYDSIDKAVKSVGGQFTAIDSGSLLRIAEAVESLLRRSYEVRKEPEREDKPKEDHPDADALLFVWAGRLPASGEIDTSKVSVRARKVLIRLGVTTYEELASKSEDDLLEVKNCGRFTIDEIRRLLRSVGLTLRVESLEK
jgi:DNA-directed RNA polymerase alpha subunit